MELVSKNVERLKLENRWNNIKNFILSYCVNVESIEVVCPIDINNNINNIYNNIDIDFQKMRSCWSWICVDIYYLYQPKNGTSSLIVRYEANRKN